MSEEIKELKARIEKLEGALAKAQVPEVTPQEMEAFKKVSAALGFGGCGINETSPCVLGPCVRPCLVCRQCTTLCVCACVNECTCGPCSPGGGSFGGGRFGGLGQ